jgi:transcriptional regulator with XRE-family HTH domain
MFPTQLKKARKYRKLNQSDVAGKLNKHVTTLSKWESGINEPNVSEAADIAKILDFPINYFYGDGEPQDMFTAKKQVTEIKLGVLEPAHAVEVNNWRIKERHTLRTPFMRSYEEQVKFQEDLASCSRRRFFSILDKDEVVPYDLVACGGFTDIIWESGIAQISLITNPDVKGIGRECVELLLDEAFLNMGLQTVHGEVYYCGNVGFWEKMLEAFEDVYQTEYYTLHWRKFWQGKLYDSLYFAFHVPSQKMLNEI